MYQGTPSTLLPCLSVGDWVDRAELHGRTSLVIHNVTRADKGIYRCEVAAPEDTHIGAEININLTVHGISLNILTLCTYTGIGCLLFKSLGARNGFVPSCSIPTGTQS